MTFLRATLIRAIRTGAQVAVAAIPTNAILLSDVHWSVVGSTVGLAMVLSVLTAIAFPPPEAK